MFRRMVGSCVEFSIGHYEASIRPQISLNSGMPLLRKMGTIEARNRGRDSADRRVILTRSMLRESLRIKLRLDIVLRPHRQCWYLTERCKVSQNISRMELEVRRNQEHR